MNECIVFAIRNQVVIKYKGIIGSYKHNYWSLVTVLKTWINHARFPVTVLYTSEDKRTGNFRDLLMDYYSIYILIVFTD